jgi:hypothetical protein
MWIDDISGGMERSRREEKTGERKAIVDIYFCNNKSFASEISFHVSQPTI